MLPSPTNAAAQFLSKLARVLLSLTHSLNIHELAGLWNVNKGKEMIFNFLQPVLVSSHQQDVALVLVISQFSDLKDSLYWDNQRGLSRRLLC